MIRTLILWIVHWFSKDRCFKIDGVDKLGIAYGSFDLVVKLM